MFLLKNLGNDFFFLLHFDTSLEASYLIYFNSCFQVVYFNTYRYGSGHFLDIWALKGLMRLWICNVFSWNIFLVYVHLSLC